jgi:hypothetical protein
LSQNANLNLDAPRRINGGQADSQLEERRDFLRLHEAGERGIQNQTVAGEFEDLPTKSLFSTCGRSGKSLVLPGVRPPGQSAS